MAEKKETPQAKFDRISEYRTKKILDDYRLMANLVRPYYKSSPQQRRNIIIQLQEGLNELKAHFEGHEKQTR
jgi:hypothetical protein